MTLSDFISRDDTGNQNPPTSSGGPGSSTGMPPAAPAFPGQPAGGAIDPLEMLVDYNTKHRSSEPTLFRDALIEQTLSVLISKNKPNPLLVGPAGVGKTKIAEDIARRIALGDSLIPDQLKNHTIYELPIAAIVAGSGIVGELEEKLSAVIDFASDPDNKAIVFIDEIHQITGSTGRSGSDPTHRKIAQILKPALARGVMSVIGATTTQEARGLDDDPAFARRFSRLIVDELTPGQTADVLATSRPGLVSHYQNQITVGDDVLAEVVRIADENARAGQHRPDNAITLLDRAMADRVLEQKRLITNAGLAGDTTTVAALQSIPSFPLTTTRVLAVAKRLMTGHAQRRDLDVQTLHDSLLEALAGQDDVLDKLVDQLDRQELNLFPSGTPTAWLFAGASGVGKTQAAKIIAEQLTGTDPIIVNMAEYHTEASTSRIVGAPPGYVGSNSNAELPFDSLESNPHRVILLDEFEKCHPAVQRLFLSALDEGYIRTAGGKHLDFSKALVIATTNAARDALARRPLGFGSGPSAMSNRSLNKVLAEFFDAELLGRFSAIVGFNALDEHVYAQIITRYYTSQREQITAARPGLAQALPPVIPDDDLQALVQDTYVPSQGARPARRAVRAWIEDTVQQARRPGPVAPTSPVDALDETPVGDTDDQVSG